MKRVTRFVLFIAAIMFIVNIMFPGIFTIKPVYWNMPKMNTSYAETAIDSVIVVPIETYSEELVEEVHTASSTELISF